MPAPWIPLATYRLQFNRDFTFADATALVPYLKALGISHVYASPYLKARAGSTHGYDIIDHNALNPEIGSAESYDRLCAALKAHDMGQILDFVPNHMGVGKADNAWWLDVLEWGEASPYADFFDIDWSAARRNFPGKVLLPTLGDQYGVVLESGDLKLRFDAEAGAFSVWYFDNRFPIRPRDYAAIIRRGLAAARPASDETVDRLENLAGEFATLSALPRSRIRRGEARERASKLKASLAELARDEAARAALERAAGLYDGAPGDPKSFVWLHNLLERQFYRLSYWRTAADEINYRRFFEVNDLAGVRPENPALFEVMHGFLTRAVANGCIHGVRLDHIDGLYDPLDYCRALQDLMKRIVPADATEPPADTTSPRGGLFYLVVEKILARHERLRDSWPVQGTSGYEFLAQVNGLLVDCEHEAAMDAVYARFIRRESEFGEILYRCKKLIIETALASELAVLAGQLDRLTEQNWRTRDFTRFRLRDALKEVVACFPVYRTYVSHEGLDPDDVRDIDWAISHARRRWQFPDPEIFDYIRSSLRAERTTPLPLPRRSDLLRFAMKFQQYTGPVTAKSLEDTSFYRYHRLIALNEVGGDPRQFGVTVAAFHRLNEERARRWPHAMLGTATHDTKRGEDACARIAVLSEIPDAWQERVERWQTLSRFRRPEVDGAKAPSRNEQYFIFQTLLGVWPAEWTGQRPAGEAEAEGFQQRLSAYLVKALREAKVHSSWTRPDEAYEAACVAFTSGLVDGSRPSPFLDDFLPFQARIAFFGALNALVRTGLKLTCPGVPDIYRGCELWDLSLVDPDNRRPVDFERRRSMLEDLQSRSWTPEDWRSALARWPDGAIKFALTHALLQARSRHPALFTHGDYAPLKVEGEAGPHVIAFSRQHAGRTLIVAMGRLFARLWGEGEAAYDGRRWGEGMLALPGDAASGAYRDAATGRTYALDGKPALPLAELLDVLPVAVLEPAA